MKGYTLIELLITMTIIGLIFSFGFASFRDFSRRQHLVSVARKLKGDLRLVQEKAIAGVKPDEFVCGAANRLLAYNFDLISANGYNLTAVCSGGTVVVKSETLPEGVSLASTLDPISFKVLGEGTNIVAAGQATLTLTQAETGSSLVVTVTTSGEIK